MLRIKFLLIVVIYVIVATSPAQVWAEQPNEQLILGFVGPLTGDGSIFGNDERNAVLLALEDVNNSGLLNGKLLKAVFEDGRCAGKDARIAAQQLVSVNKVQVILGGVCSGETLAAAPIAESNRVVLLSVISSHPDIATAGAFVFRLAPNDAQGARLAARLVKQGGYSAAGAISENTDYALGFREVFFSSLKDAPIRVVADETYNPGENDYKSLLLRVAAKKPQVLLVNPQGGVSAGTLLKQLRDLNIRSEVIGTFAFSTTDTVAAAGGPQALEGVRFVDVPAVESESGLKFIDRFTRRFGTPQTPFQVVLRYDSVWLIAKAIKDVGYDGKRIRQWLNRMPWYQGTEFTFRFDDAGEPLGIDYVVKHYQQGKIINVPSH